MDAQHDELEVWEAILEAAHDVSDFVICQCTGTCRSGWLYIRRLFGIGFLINRKYSNHSVGRTNRLDVFARNHRHGPAK